MELITGQSDQKEGLRLVKGNPDDQSSVDLEKQFVNFIFFKVDSAWRRLPAMEKDAGKHEFIRIFKEFSSDLMLFPYSLIGFDTKADLMLWRIGDSLDRIQEMTAKLFNTRLGGFLETSDNYLAVTKNMNFVAGGSNDRELVTPATKKYHFVYPCTKQDDWYARSPEERDAMIEDNFMVGHRFPNINIHLTHAFGFSDKEYIVSFETDEPKEFLALAEELRNTPASRMTTAVMRIYMCRSREIGECLNSLG